MTDQPTIDFAETTFIYSHTALDELRRIGGDVEELTEVLNRVAGANLCIYPDGSLQFEGETCYQRFQDLGGRKLQEHALAQANQSLRPQHLLRLGVTAYRGIDAFSRKLFVLYAWGDFATKNDGCFLRVFPGNPAAPNACPPGPLDNMLVTIVLKRRLSKAARKQLMKLIIDWGSSLRSRGLFDEGPVLLRENHVRVFDRVLQFHIDARRTGQLSMNWLVLKLVDFCPINLITNVHFTERFDRYFTFAEEYKLVAEQAREEPMHW